MSMLDKLRAKASEKYLFEVVEPEAILRSAANADADEIGKLEYGQVVLLREIFEDGWGRLADDEVWAAGFGYPNRVEEEWPPKPVYVLVDGTLNGLPRFLKRSQLPLEEWQYAEAIRCASANGVSWKKIIGGLRPKPLLDLAWVSPWHTPDGEILQAPALLHEPFSYHGWALPKLCVASLVRGARPAALEDLILHHFYNGFERVVLYFDAPDDPDEAEAIKTAEQFLKPLPLGPGGLKCSAKAVRCNVEWWQNVRNNSRFYQREKWHLPLYREVVHLDSVVKDVQARQQLVIEHALLEAQDDDFQWLLHVDADEIFFCPDTERHSDARKFFDEVPPMFTAVRFPNLEGVPESLEVEDAFHEVTLFKMNHHLMAELGVEARILACGDVAEEDQEEEDDLFNHKHVDSQPGYTSGYKRIPRKERHALRRLLSVMHEIADKRTKVLQKLDVKLPPIISKAPVDDDDSDFSDDESCQGPKPHCPSFFNSYSNGKVAVRTKIGPEGEYPALPAGVHGFVRDNGQLLYELASKGPGAPVILHYANIGFSDWKKKYEILCHGHGTPDGAFDTKREGIAEVRSHMATRELTLRGNQHELQQFYKTFVQGNEFDEVAFLAQFGMALRLCQPRDRLALAHKQWQPLKRKLWRMA